MKTKKKLSTDDLSIDRAEKTLGFKYPQLIRERLKQRNGFEWGGFHFFPVLDDEDKQHTFDDIVRENTNEVSGWNQSIPEGYVCIASSDLECLLINTNNDGKIYFYVVGHDTVEITFETGTQLSQFLDENDLFFEFDSEADKKYFTKLVLYTIFDGKRLTLMFHNQPVLRDSAQGLLYCSKVEAGQRGTAVLEQEISEITGSKDYVLERVYDDGSDFDRHGSEIKRLGLVVRVPHFNTFQKRFPGLGNAYMSWFNLHHDAEEEKSEKKPNDLDRAMNLAVITGNIIEIERLIQEGVSVHSNKVSEAGYLFAASQFDESEAAEVLIKHGANIHAKEKWNGNTPLHQAAVFGSYKVAEVLLQNGADREAKNNRGKRPIDLASTVKVRNVLTVSNEEKVEFKNDLARASAVIEHLDRIGYFIYVPNYLQEKVKENVVDSLISGGTLSGGLEEDSIIALNPREYITDSEELAEQGVGSVLTQMEGVLREMGVKISTVEDIDMDDDGYSVLINGNPYEIFEEGDTDSSWSKAHKRLVEIVNELLKQNNSDERLYGQSSNNDAMSIFLTQEQYEYINSLEEIDADWKPTPSDLMH